MSTYYSNNDNTSFTIMASSSLFRTAQKIVLSEKAIQACHRVQRDVFAHLPQLNIRTGHQTAKIGFTGEYTSGDRYFHATIDPIARKVRVLLLMLR
jgi:flagellar biosynthesis/type III secretory pathway ATPase